ncbi:MAG: RnfABCDGE type electron transport complex subunit G [Gammaproteobacteria bacterium]|nr:RnfABCDGE type electron transport complex subunit G [Gammaproteobacteria bacterium]
MRKSCYLPALPAFLMVAALAVVGLRFGAGHAEAAAQSWQREQLQRALAEVRPPRHDNDPIAEQVVLTDAQLLGLNRSAIAYPLRLGGTPAGVVLELDALEGYGGDIRMLVGIDEAGRVTRVLVVAHQETGGFGDAIEADKSNWTDGFTGSELAGSADSDWQERASGGAFDAISGATITSRAMIAGVHVALRLYQAKRAEVFGGTP